jgi:diguanylate cyclase (GGDEF)-like protein
MSATQAAAHASPREEALAVLLVNDDPGTLFALRTVLSDLSADIVTASSGEGALLRLLKQDFCVILLDVKMAGIDGFETAHLVRSRPRSRDTPIVFLTSHRASDLDRTRGLDVGASDYVFMPVAPELLKAKVQAFIDRAHERPLQRHGDTGAHPPRAVPDAVPARPGAHGKTMPRVHDRADQKEMEAYVVHQSFHDSLTGLPNRLLLLDRLGRATAHRAAFQAQVAVLFIDLDHFKEVNDTLGHAAGDRLLQMVAERLTDAVREGDTVARLGGDEFVVMLVDLHQLIDAALVAEKIVAAVSGVCQIDGNEVQVTPSIGLAIFPDDGLDPDTLLRNADTAMYHTKHDGGAHFSFFTREMQALASQRLALGSALQRAIRGNEFVMHYQPKVHASSGAIVGFEALIRWPQADGIPISPSLFIPIAEETGRIDPIGAWAIGQVAAELQRWAALGFGDVPIAVNVSALQFRRTDVAHSLAEAVALAQIAPGLLEVELTESGVMNNPLQAIETLRQIHALGMTIAIDDFGTGYSSLSYLKRFPIDKLKIDASFVRDIATDPSDAAIVLAIIGLAHVLDLTVIAEGVETEAQMAFLIEHGCDELQGHLFSAAVSNDDALAMLQRGPFDIAHAAQVRS